MIEPCPCGTTFVHAYGECQGNKKHAVILARRGSSSGRKWYVCSKHLPRYQEKGMHWDIIINAYWVPLRRTK